MILCTCNVITDRAFNQAVTEKKSELSGCRSLLDATGEVYREARDVIQPAMNNELGAPRMGKDETCTTCFNWLAKQIQKEGLFEGQTIPPKRFDLGCPRRAQCFRPVVISTLDDFS